MASACASCIFGAASTTTLSFPGVVQSIPVYPVTTTYSNGSTARAYSTAFYESQGTAITTVYQESEVVWTVSGTVLTYPTHYIQYLAFQGAAVTDSAPSSCAESLSATPLTLPASTDAASFIYPDNVGPVVPLGLLNYLDTFSDFIGQLAGDQLTACSLIPTGFTAVPPSGPPQPSTAPATTSVVSTQSPTSTATSTAPTTNTTTTSAEFTSTQTSTTSTTLLTTTSTSFHTSFATTATTSVVPKSSPSSLTTVTTTSPTTTTTFPPATTTIHPTTTTAVSTAIVTSSTTAVVSHSTVYVVSTAGDTIYASTASPSFSSSSSSPTSSLNLPTALPDTLAPPTTITTTTTTSTTSSSSSSINLGVLLSAFSSLEVSEHPTLSKSSSSTSSSSTSTSSTSISSSTTSTLSIITTTTMIATVPPTTRIPGFYTNSTSSYVVGPVTASAPSSPATNATSTLSPFKGAAASHLRAPQGTLGWSECILALLLSAFL